jgi:hypothetical protein
MPKIQWVALPLALRDHLFERLRERKISAEDLFQLKLWRESEPSARKVFGTRTSAPSRSARNGSIRRLSCSEGSPPRGKNYERAAGRDNAASSEFDLGYFDDETCRLEPIQNPFGPIVLPMCPE